MLAGSFFHFHAPEDIYADPSEPGGDRHHIQAILFYENAGDQSAKCYMGTGPLHCGHDMPRPLIETCKRISSKAKNIKQRDQPYITDGMVKRCSFA